MLIFNPGRVFHLRGIENPQALLVQNGFTPTTAHRLLNRQKAWISFEYIERFCVMLHCEPSDLFEWRDDAKTVLGENHPLKSLKRTETVRKFSEIVKEIPLEKLSRIEALLNEPEN